MQLSLSRTTDPGHVTSHALKELILKHKVVIIYLHAITMQIANFSKNGRQIYTLVQNYSVMLTLKQTLDTKNIWKLLK
jgi:hypothetical protein